MNNKDIDLLGRAQSNDLENIRTIVQQIAQIEVSDGVVFKPETTTVEIIKETDEYSGVRVKIGAFLTSARQTLPIDIGFGDRIVSGPVELEFPVLLDQPAPRIKGYSKESVIAEKFEAHALAFSDPVSPTLWRCGFDAPGGGVGVF